jgi:hypothetical protein
MAQRPNAGNTRPPLAATHRIFGGVVTDYDVSKNMFAIVVVLLNALSFASLAYVANRTWRPCWRREHGCLA